VRARPRPARVEAPIGKFAAARNARARFCEGPEHAPLLLAGLIGAAFGKSDSAILAAHARLRGARTLGVHDDAAPFVTSRRSKVSWFRRPRAWPLRASIALFGFAIGAALSKPVAHGLSVEADEPSRLGEVPAGLLVRAHDAIFDGCRSQFPARLCHTFLSGMT